MCCRAGTPEWISSTRARSPETICCPRTPQAAETTASTTSRQRRSPSVAVSEIAPAKLLVRGVLGEARVLVETRLALQQGVPEVHCAAARQVDRPALAGALKQ